MLERLVGRLLNNVLSKFFVYQSNDEGVAAGDGAQHSLGVWSGYIALDNLRLKTEVVNDFLQKQGLPFEVLHCTIRRVEITVPWSKLRSTSSSTPGDSGAVVVIVMDGIHVLARTHYEFQDAKMRKQFVDQRRAKFEGAQSFEHKQKPTKADTGTQSSWYSLGGVKEFVQKRIAEGLIQQIVDRLHLHVRDLHIRLEDAETSPAHPFACGIVMESVHVQHRDEDPTSNGEDLHNELFPDRRTNQNDNKEVIRKVAQVNHYAIYWNALGYQEGLPLEHSVLHQLSSLQSPQFMTEALDRGIARRTSSLWSATSGRFVMPTHNYLLMPVDCTVNGLLAVDTSGRNEAPYVEVSLHVDAINVQLRDFQCHQILLLLHSIKEHNFTKPYRRFRPQVAVSENPRAWWKYAFRVISHELKGSRLRWSWGRMRQCYAGRYRYCELYERKLKHSFYRNRNRDSMKDLASAVESTFYSTPDDGAGPSLQNDTNNADGLPQDATALQGGPHPLSTAEAQELQDLEDGILGDMSVDDILLYRLLVHGRLGQGYQELQQQAIAQQSFTESWIFGSTLVQNAIANDMECQQEVERLMAYMEQSSAEVEAHGTSGQDLQNVVFLSVRLHWKEGHFTVFSPLPSTANEPSLLRRLHERFLDFTFDRLTLGLNLMGDYETATINATLLDYAITEMRFNQERQSVAILSRRNPCEAEAETKNMGGGGQHTWSSSDRKVSFQEEEKAAERNNGTQNDAHATPLLFAEVQLNPSSQEGCGIMVAAKLEAVEIVLSPDCHWLGRLKDFLRHSLPSGLGNMEDYWRDLNYASMNAWASTRLGLQAKAEAAMENHTPMKLDIEVDLPVIQIIGDRNKKFWIDLGRAHLQTIKLAGVATMDLQKLEESRRYERQNSPSASMVHVRKLRSAFDQASSAFEDSDPSLLQGLKPPGDTDSFMTGPSGPVTLDNQTPTSFTKHAPSNHRGVLRSVSQPRGDTSTHATRQHEGDIHSSFFYDVYQLQIETGDAIVGEWCETRKGIYVAGMEDPVLPGIHISIHLHKSIIPADNTLCRLKVDCMVGEICAHVSPATVVYMAGILKTWKAVMSDPPTGRNLIPRFAGSQGISTRSLRLPALPDNQEAFDDPQKEFSEGSVDDQDFFDAVEHDDHSDQMSVWLEDNWIADADSVLSEEHLLGTPQRRRHKPAMSDVSSLSDRSFKKKRGQREQSAYLNEENLARLEEGISEEGSFDDDNDSDSFHSVMTPSKFTELIAQLDIRIKETQEMLDLAKQKVDELSTLQKGQPQNGSVGSDSTKQRRLVKRSLRIEQERLRAELKELIATRNDLAHQRTELEGGMEDQQSQANGANGYDLPARRASQLLSSRKSQEKTADAIQHSMIRNLNPQLFQCTLVMSKVSLKLCCIEDLQGGDTPFDVVVCLSNGALALRNSANETKAFLSVENAHASYSKRTGSQPQQRYLMLGGSQYSLASTLLPLHFPQFVSSASMADTFLKCTLEVRHRPAMNHSLSSPEIVRLRVAIGDLEVTPDPNLLGSLLECGSKTMQSVAPPNKSSSSKVVDKEPKKKEQASTAYLEMSVQCASIGTILLHNGNAVAALYLSELGARFAVSSANVAYKGRKQIDCRCTNLQLLHIEDLYLGKGSEMLGRRDPYQALVQVRLRSQLVPSTEVGGWVSGSNSSPLQAVGEEDGLVWNTHVGAKVNCLGVVLVGPQLLDLTQSIQDLLKISAPARTDDDRSLQSPNVAEATALGNSGPPVTVDSEQKYPFRWRADLVIKKTSITLACQEYSETETREMGRNSLVLMWTFLASMEECAYRDAGISVQAALTDTSILRASDELHLLEPWNILLKGHLDLKIQDKRAFAPTMKLSVDSPWNEIAAVLHRHGWDVPRDESSADNSTSLSLLVTPLKIRVSAQVCGFLAEFARSFASSEDSPSAMVMAPREASETPETRTTTQVQETSTATEVQETMTATGTHETETFTASEVTANANPAGLNLVLAIESVDLILFRETGAKTIDPFSSLVVNNMEVSLQKDRQSTCLNARVTDFLVYDRSFRPGMCSVARKYFHREHENPGPPNKFFLAVQIHLAEAQEGSTVARVDLHFGKIKFKLLPPLIQGLLGFQADARNLTHIDGGRDVADDPKQNSHNEGSSNTKTKIDFLSGHVEFCFSFVVDGFEFVLPSRDISTYIREHGVGPINVVCFRWKSRGEANFILCGFDRGSRILTKLKSRPEDVGSEEFGMLVDRYARQATSSNPKSRLLAAKFQLTVHGFQVLRTCVLPLPRSENDTSPYYFKVSPPTAGEQLITTPFDFNVGYLAHGARLCFLSQNGDDACSKCASSFEFGHSLRVEAQLVDVLLYIAQSAGGITDAMRVTVSPVLEMLARKESRDVAPEKVNQKDVSPRETDSMSRAIKRAPVVCSIKAEGIRVTCVPGGATKLTESPIINFSLRKFTVGLAICPVPVETKLAFEGLVDKKSVVPRFRELHLMLGAWLKCELSASYHNRRLVAWEPFIEPWTMELRFGADLVNLLKLPAIADSDGGGWQSDLEQGDRFSTYTSERLRKFLRAPFRRSVGSEKEANDEAKQIRVGTDLGYLLLAFSSKSLVASALHPSVSEPIRNSLSLKDLASFLPSINPMKWLVCFGHPMHDDTQSSRPSFSCTVSDAQPLNINLSGALIENLLGYLKQEKKSRTVAPHWIRNDSGLTLRFREVLDEERVARGERASKVTLSNGSEVPLSLKRTLSQSSDPHRAYILIELGSFEDTVGRIDHQEFDIPKGSLSSIFFYKVVAKVPVDTVGIYTYKIDRNFALRKSARKVESDSPSLGWLIVRVALQGGIKLVSVESPLALKNDTDADLLCEVRAHDRLSLLWRCLIPKPQSQLVNRSYVPVDIVSFVNDKSSEFTVEALPRNSSFSHESELTSGGGENAMKILAPPAYSQSSLTRGLINEIDVTFKALGYSELFRSNEEVHLNICSLRIGRFNASKMRSSSKRDKIPEQRMLLFRSPLAFRNHLAFPIAAQIRVKKTSSANSSGEDQSLDDSGWEDLGVLECGETTSWTGAVSMDEVELRLRFVAKAPETSRRFVAWSSVATIPPLNYERRGGAKGENRAPEAALPKLCMMDTSGLPLELSLKIADGSIIHDTNTNSIKEFSSQLAPANRVVSIFVPFWIVDSTGQDLEFCTRTLVAGQFDSREDFFNGNDMNGSISGRGMTTGLHELLEDAKLSHLPSKSSFTILLLGDDRSKKLSIRQRLLREDERNGLAAPWSDPIPLRSAENRHTDVTVMPPHRDFKHLSIDQNEALEPLALRSRVVSAPEKFGGKLGTKLVHLVCRYAMVNELGREIEIVAEHSEGKPVLIRADGRPKPFHFDDSGPIQMRPKEFGWVWSGRFYIRNDRREAVLRIRHKLKRHTIIVSAEIHNKQKSGMCIIVFRAASHPPFRFENNTMYPLQFVQTFLATNENDILHNREVASSETILLPYHREDFAWDEPEHKRKSVQFEVADFGNTVKHSMLGRFNLDEIAPGTELKMDSPLFVGQVLADGPTRVLRISEASMPELPRAGANNQVKLSDPNDGNLLTFSINIELTHGLGVSVIDWSPQELLFLRLEEIAVSQRVDKSKQTIEGSIGRISIDNQLWISPYPVLLEMGSKKLASTLAQIARRKNRRHRAMSLSLCRPLISASLYGDLTFLEWLEFVTDPVNIYVDGNLAISLSRMLQQVVELGFEGEDTFESRNSTLRKVLSISENAEKRRKASMETADVYSADDAVATAAIAAKARSSRDSVVADLTGFAVEGARPQSLAKTRQKCYIERLRISTTKLEISWSGSLPFVSLPRLIPLSLTFEGLPLLLRPYSSSHAYGTVEDHLQSLKGHYLSFWRILDLLVGLAFKPTFLFNAVLYTWSESIATSFGSVSRGFAQSREALLLRAREAQPQPTYEDGVQISKKTSLQRKAAIPFLRLFSWWLSNGENVTRFVASLFRYDPTRYSGASRTKAGLVRTRNPRLFANVDGKDLLVEYTEGENAGKALLSRVRMGMHLGEGYICHVEGLYQKAMGVWSNNTKVPGTLILMMTFERMVLVKGTLSQDFCSVVWEVTFDNLVHVEADESEDAGFDLLTIWYLANKLQDGMKGEEHLLSRYAKSHVGDGLDNLLRLSVFVPHGHVDALVKKVHEAKEMLYLDRSITKLLLDDSTLR